MPKGCVTCMDEMLRKMAGNMNGLGPGKNQKGKGVLTGRSPCYMLVYSIFNISILLSVPKFQVLQFDLQFATFYQ